MAAKDAPATKVLTKEIRLLPCRLTDEEWAQRAGELASVVADVSLEESRQKSAKAEMKARLEELAAKRDRLGNVVTRHEEQRDVQVEIVADFGIGKAETIRKDTYEVIHSRPLTDHERQMGLFKPKKTDAGEAAVQ